MMDLDVKELSEEIRQIEQEYRHTNDKFREVFGRRGRGRGRFRGRGRRRPFGSDFGYDEIDRVVHAEWKEQEPRVMSSIAGVNRDRVQRDYIPPVILKRPAVHGADDDPKLKNRNRRIFSSLLTTLEKFREENDTLEKSEKWKKREEIEERATLKKAEESIRLREQQKKEWEERRVQEEKRLKDLEIKRNVKNLQLLYAKRISHRQEVLAYIPTDVQPMVYWIPAKHNVTTRSMLGSLAEEYESWKTEQEEKFKEEKERVEKGLPVEEPEAKLRSTIHVAEKMEETDEEHETFKPMSELNNEAAEVEGPAAKKPKLKEETEEK